MTSTPQILCVSANPAIDRRIVLRHFAVGEVNRAKSVDPAAGGKAAHVAFAAKALGADVRWLAFLGGAEGEGCRRGVESRGVTPVVVPIAGRTRTNLELIDELNKTITEVLEPGPRIADAEREEFEKRFDEEIARHPVVVISGSLPQGLSDTFYRDLVARAKNAGCPVVLDASGAALREALSARPDCIKPNRDEASALLSREIVSVEDAVEAAQALRQRGPDTVIVSLGEKGAVAVGKDFAFHGIPPKVKAISTVGAGDSFLAGWTVAFARKDIPLQCVFFAVASGTANCLAQSPGVIEREEVLRLLSDVSVAHI